METNTSGNLARSKAFFLALEQHDEASLADLLADDVVETVPLSNKGDQEPYIVYEGKDAVLGYLGLILKNFSRTALLEKQYTVSDDGQTVFLEAKGDLVQRGTEAPYRNVYVFKHVYKNGRIISILEYANPITYAKLVGDPIG